MLHLFLPISDLLQATLPHTITWIYTQHNTAPMFSIAHNSVCLNTTNHSSSLPTSTIEGTTCLPAHFLHAVYCGHRAQFFMLFLHHCFQTKLNSLWKRISDHLPEICMLFRLQSSWSLPGALLPHLASFLPSVGTFSLWIRRTQLSVQLKMVIITDRQCLTASL